MANVRDSDTSLWLHNKLGTSNDSWLGGSIWSQLNSEVLRNIRDCFIELQTQVKIKLLLSFFQIPKRNLEEWRSEIDDILEVAAADSEAWVAMIAEIMKPYPGSGNLNSEISEPEDNKRIYVDMMNEIQKLIKEQGEAPKLLPLECTYLNKNALDLLTGTALQPVKHFQLKRKPKAAALREELLNKSVEAANNLKRNVVPTVPLRTRGLPRKMNDTTPLKGIPSRNNSNNGFRAGISRLSLATSIVRPMVRPLAGHKEGGIKLLDINEQPMGSAQAKKRKRIQEIETSSKPSENANTTPDYAVGLTPSNPPTPGPPVSSISYLPPANPTTPVIPTYTSLNTVQVNPISTSTLQNHENIPQTLQMLTNVTNFTTNEANQPTTPVSFQDTAQIKTYGQVFKNSVQEEPPAKKSNLQLTKEQMTEAQEMFRNSNKVTRPEKALILGFMAGSRKNPCPHLGNIVTIKLSENKEVILQPDGSSVAMLAETHFQMNYNTGEWKRIRKFRRWEDA